MKSPDYKDTPQDEAVADFLSRIQLYEQRYEPIDDKTEEKNFSFIKIFNCGERFLVHKIGGEHIRADRRRLHSRRSRPYSKSRRVLSHEYSRFATHNLSHPSKRDQTVLCQDTIARSLAWRIGTERSTTHWRRSTPVTQWKSGTHSSHSSMFTKQSLVSS